MTVEVEGEGEGRNVLPTNHKTGFRQPEQLRTSRRHYQIALVDHINNFLLDHGNLERNPRPRAPAHHDAGNPTSSPEVNVVSTQYTRPLTLPIHTPINTSNTHIRGREAVTQCAAAQKRQSRQGLRELQSFSRPQKQGNMERHLGTYSTVLQQD